MCVSELFVLFLLFSTINHQDTSDLSLFGGDQHQHWQTLGETTELYIKLLKHLEQQEAAYAVLSSKFIANFYRISRNLAKENVKESLF